MDFKKCLKAATISIIAMIAIWGVSTVVSLVPVIGLVGGIIGVLQFFVLNPILLAYAGFAMVKGNKGSGLIDGAVSGGIAGFASSLVIAILSTILMLVGIGAAVSGSGSEAAAYGAAAAGIGIVVQFGMVIAITIAGLVLGAIGAFAAGARS